MTPRFWLVLALAAGMAAPAFAQQQTSPADDMAEAAREALAKIMRSLSGVIDTIPMYEKPEVLPNGDIIIRRKPPAAKPQPAPPATPPGQTRT